MKIYTSYFYQLRFFKPYMIPLSTAVWDPKWYHNNYDQDYTFVDKNGVINGLRCEALHPGPFCEGACRGTTGNAPGCTHDPESCAFLKLYLAQLNKLDKADYLRRIENLCRKVQKELGFTEEPVAVLMVHEAPSNPCSERLALQQWAGCTELPYPIK